MRGRIEFPRPGSIIYRRIHVDERTWKKSRKRLKRFNNFIVPLYRTRLLPLVGFGRFWLLLQHTGRKTWKKRYTPIFYGCINGAIHIFSASGEKADWMKNIRANPDDVFVQVGSRKFRAKVEFVDDLFERENFWRWFLRENPRLAKSMIGWDSKRDNPETVDLSFLVRNVNVVRLHCLFQ